MSMWCLCDLINTVIYQYSISYKLLGMMVVDLVIHRSIKVARSKGGVHINY